MKKCIICGNLHRRTCQTCCKECNEIYKKQKDDEQQKVIKEQGGDCCKICGRYTHGMFKHLKSAHDLTVEEYNTKYNDNVKKFSEYWRQQKSGHTFKKGKDNPAYQHGGKFSPFSKNYIYKDKTDIEEVKQKAAQTRKEHPENNPTRIEYWLVKTKGNYEEAKRLLTERQTTFSRELCILKYGLEEGVKRWEERQNKWMNTLSSKSNDEKLEILEKKATKEISKPEQIVKDILIKNFGENNVVHQFALIGDLGEWVYDFKVFDKILVEVNGDYWHMNPKLYLDENAFNNSKQMTAKEIWKRDNDKMTDAKFNGYKPITIWEDDLKENNLPKTVEKLVSDIKNLIK